MANNVAEVSLHLWGDEDLPLIQQLMSDPQVMEYLGGPESAERHNRFILGDSIARYLLS